MGVNHLPTKNLKKHKKSSKVSLYKIQDNHGKNFTINTEHDNTLNSKVYSMTGLIIFKTEDFKNIDVIYNNVCILDNNNHDSRIYKIDNEIYLSYGVYYKKNKIVYKKIFFRKMTLDMPNQNIYLSKKTGYFWYF